MRDTRPVDVASNRAAWDVAAHKYVDETDALLAEAAGGSSLAHVEEVLLAPLLAGSPRVIHVQSGHGLDDHALVAGGASQVVGVDFSDVTVLAAQTRAQALGLPIDYIVAEADRIPITGGWADVVYTGKGAHMWLANLATWASEIHRVLRPGGSFFLYDAHPAAPLWTWDPDRPGIRPDVSYFGGTRANDTFPASGITTRAPGSGLVAIERQWTLADVVTALLSEGLVLDHLGEYPEPFWQPALPDSPAAWSGNLPNTFSVLAHRPRALPWG